MSERENKPYNWKKTHEEYIPGEITRMVNDLGLDESAGNMAEQVHQMALDADYTHRDADALASACLFAAARLQGAALSLDDVAEVSREEEKVIHTTYRTLSRALDLSIEPNDVEPFVKRYTDALEFPESSAELALRLARDARDEGFDGRMAPQSLAASLVYIVSRSDGLDHTQKEIKKATGVAPETLRNHYRELADELDVEVRSRRGTSSTDRREPPADFDQAIQRLRDEFDVPESVLADVHDLLENPDESKSVAGRVAGAFWTVIQGSPKSSELSQSELAYEMGVSEATIQNRVKEYREALRSEE